MLMTTSEAVMSATRLRSLSMSAPFLPITTPGRAEWIVHAALLVRTLDHDPGDSRLLELLVQDLADLDILVQQLAVFVLAGEPTGIHVRLMPRRSPIGLIF